MDATNPCNPSDADQWTRLIRTLEGPCRQLRAPMMVEQPPADFVGRPEHLNELRNLLAGEEPTGSVAIAAALKGAGGYGKTTLARALCHDEVVRETFHDGILWVTLGETPPDPFRAIEEPDRHADGDGVRTDVPRKPKSTA